MKNITVSVSEDVYRNARIRAAERGSSVSALVADYLRSLSDGGAEFARLQQQQRRIQQEIGEFRRVTVSIAISSTSVRFADTNVLLYAISTDASEQDKAALANSLLDAPDLCLSVQVLQEFYVQATRASRSDAISHDQAAALIESFLRFPVQETTADLMRAALTTSRRFGISYWDAAILEASRSLGATVVLSEDLSDGMGYDGVRVENPFREAS